MRHLMNQDNNSNCENEMADPAVRFFGAMTASSTHEMKNALAIINENAGLLEDLVLLDNTAKEKLPERVASISGRIKKQVKRSDAILKNLNRFSHTMDKSGDFVELNSVIDFMVLFGGRLLQRNNCSIKVENYPSDVNVKSTMFQLQHFIWRIIEALCYDKNQQITIKIGIMKKSGTPFLRFSPQKIEHDILNQVFESPYNQRLIEVIGIRTQIDNTNKYFELLWSK